LVKQGAGWEEQLDLLLAERLAVVDANKRYLIKSDGVFMAKTCAANLRATLVQNVRNRLANLFLERGFSLIPLPPKETNSELKKAFPLGRLKRKRANQLDVIEFQFDKYGKPKFVINFGIVPEGGVNLPWGDFLDQDAADVSSLSDAYRLYSSTFRARWFELGLLSSKDEQGIIGLVDKAIMLSNEVDDWFESKTIGAHMREFGLR
jgi:hypothetical protein